MDIYFCKPIIQKSTLHSVQASGVGGDFSGKKNRMIRAIKPLFRQSAAVHPV
jgi:hypothetical protein